MTWPPRWDGPRFKAAGSRKVARGLKREKRAAGEKKQKGTVRARDRYCRFPLCGCKRFQLATKEVSHSRHKGMGGNPKGERSAPELMILLCSARHKENVFSVDRGTIRWRALTDKGSAGPVAWDVDVNRLRADYGAHAQNWREVARETAIHIYEPLTPFQRSTLERLKEMEL